MLNSTETIAYIQEFEQELTRLRQEPQSFIPALEDKLYSLKGGKLKIRPGVEVEVEGGEDNITNLISQLSGAKKVVTPLQANMGMSLQGSELSELVDYFQAIQVGTDRVLGDIQRPCDVITSFMILGELSSIWNDIFSNFALRINESGVDMLLTSDLKDTIVSSIIIEPMFTEIQDCRTGITDKLKKYGKPILKQKAKDKYRERKYRDKGASKPKKKGMFSKAKDVFKSKDKHAAEPGHGYSTRQNTLYNNKKDRVKLVKY